MSNLASEPASAGASQKAIRESIFISHATPKDNAFTLWLSNRLDALGYDVWADRVKAAIRAFDTVFSCFQATQT